jgi:hypothetical protein
MSRSDQNHKLRETFDVILGGERVDEAPPLPAPEDAGAPRTSPGAPGPQSRTTQRTIRSQEVNRYVTLAEGGFFYPNFISDYLMRELSLGEQSVLNRLLRLTQGVEDPADRLRIHDVAAACGITPELAASTLESLQEKGLMRVMRQNPFTRSIRYRLDVLKQWQGKLVLCAVCHGSILPGQEASLVPIARSARGIQEVPVHDRCLDGDPA